MPCRWETYWVQQKYSSFMENAERSGTESTVKSHEIFSDESHVSLSAGFMQFYARNIKLLYFAKGGQEKHYREKENGFGVYTILE